MSASIEIRIIAPSSRVPQVELGMGSDKMREAGFKVEVHPQCRKSHLFFAGTDPERAQAFFDSAQEPGPQVLWCARGGSGATRLLPILDRLTAERGVPREKLLVGYSDATLLHEYVRERWGWKTLHGAVPGLREFSLLSEPEWKSTVELVQGRELSKAPWGRLRFVGARPSSAVEGEVIGGNLTIWATLMGTPYQPKASGKILFFEDVGEYLYRIDRVVSQIELSGGFSGVKAILLGSFLGCRDSVPPALVARPTSRKLERVLRTPKGSELKDLRKKLDEKKMIPAIFAEIGAKYGIPVAQGLPVGHGPGHAPLPLGARYHLDPEGNLRLLSWNWRPLPGQ